MREIKFRIFNKKTNEYINNSDNPHNADYREDWYCVEQFTGLTDKNGTEIYENDIINDGSCVIFNNGCFKTTYEGDQQGGNILSEKRCKYIEVIGNIHDKK
jgi:hypothetical protein